jgi:hypothetical protein
MRALGVAMKFTTYVKPMMCAAVARYRIVATGACRPSVGRGRRGAGGVLSISSRDVRPAEDVLLFDDNG